MAARSPNGTRHIPFPGQLVTAYTNAGLRNRKSWLSDANRNAQLNFSRRNACKAMISLHLRRRAERASRPSRLLAKEIVAAAARFLHRHLEQVQYLSITVRFCYRQSHFVVDYVTREEYRRRALSKTASADGRGTRRGLSEDRTAVAAPRRRRFNN